MRYKTTKSIKLIKSMICLFGAMFGTVSIAPEELGTGLPSSSSSSSSSGQQMPMERLSMQRLHEVMAGTGFVEEPRIQSGREGFDLMHLLGAIQKKRNKRTYGKYENPIPLNRSVQQLEEIALRCESLDLFTDIIANAVGARRAVRLKLSDRQAADLRRSETRDRNALQSGRSIYSTPTPLARFLLTMIEEDSPPNRSISFKSFFTSINPDHQGPLEVLFTLELELIYGNGVDYIFSAIYPEMEEIKRKVSSMGPNEKMSLRFHYPWYPAFDGAFTLNLPLCEDRILSNVPDYDHQVNGSSRVNTLNWSNVSVIATNDPERRCIDIKAESTPTTTPEMEAAAIQVSLMGLGESIQIPQDLFPELFKSNHDLISKYLLKNVPNYDQINQITNPDQLDEACFRITSEHDLREDRIYVKVETWT